MVIKNDRDLMALSMTCALQLRRRHGHVPSIWIGAANKLLSEATLNLTVSESFFLRVRMIEPENSCFCTVYRKEPPTASRRNGLGSETSRAIERPRLALAQYPEARGLKVKPILCFLWARLLVWRLICEWATQLLF